MQNLLRKGSKCEMPPLVHIERPQTSSNALAQFESALVREAYNLTSP